MEIHKESQSTAKESLKALYNVVYHIPGWLKTLETVGYGPTAITFLEKLDEKYLTWIKKAETDYKEKAFDRSSERFIFIDDIRKEHGQKFLDARKLEFLNSRIKHLEKRLQFCEERDERLRKRDMPWWLRSAAKDISGWEKIEIDLQRALIERTILLNPALGGSRKTPDQIGKALRVPFKVLIKLKGNFALCPFHEETQPSFYVKKGFGYCFGCQKSWDTISFIMETKSLSFRQAVELLLKF